MRYQYSEHCWWNKNTKVYRGVVIPKAYLFCKRRNAGAHDTYNYYRRIKAR